MYQKTFFSWFQHQASVNCLSPTLYSAALTLLRTTEEAANCERSESGAAPWFRREAAYSRLNSASSAAGKSLVMLNSLQGNNQRSIGQLKRLRPFSNPMCSNGGKGTGASKLFPGQRNSTQTALLSNANHFARSSLRNFSQLLLLVNSAALALKRSHRLAMSK